MTFVANIPNLALIFNAVLACGELLPLLKTNKTLLEPKHDLSLINCQICRKFLFIFTKLACFCLFSHVVRCKYCQTAVSGSTGYYCAWGAEKWMSTADYYGCILESGQRHCGRSDRQNRINPGRQPLSLQPTLTSGAVTDWDDIFWQTVFDKQCVSAGRKLITAHQAESLGPPTCCFRQIMCAYLYTFNIPVSFW